MPYTANDNNWQWKETQPQQNKRKYDEAFQPPYTQRNLQSETASTSSMESTISYSNAITPRGDVFPLESTVEGDPNLGLPYLSDIADIPLKSSRFVTTSGQQAYLLAAIAPQHGNLALNNASVDTIGVADTHGHCILSDNSSNPYDVLAMPGFQTNDNTNQPVSYPPEVRGLTVEFQQPPVNMHDEPWTPYNIRHAPPPGNSFRNSFADDHSSSVAYDRTNTALQGGRNSSRQALPKVKHPDNVINKHRPEDNAGTTGVIQPVTRARRTGPLDKHVKDKAKIMREVGSCWGCRVKRASCDFGPDMKICKACQSKREPNREWLCCQIRLLHFADVFLPEMLCAQHRRDKLAEFCSQRIKKWTGNEMRVSVTWGYGHAIECDVMEVEPRGNTLLFQNQWRNNIDTDQYEHVRTASPPIAIVRIAEEEWRHKLNSYLDETLQNDFEGFPDNCIRGKDVLVQKELLKSIFQYYSRSSDPANGTLGLCLKHVLLTHIVTHSLTLVEETKATVFQQLLRPPSQPYGIHTSSRMLNKQLKFVLFALHQQQLKDLLKEIDKALHASNKPPWAVAFASVLLLTMTTESMQITVRCKESTDKCEGTRTTNDEEATQSIEEMEKFIDFIQKLFQVAYRTDTRKGFKNPIQNIAYRNDLEIHSQVLAQEVKEIIDRHRPFFNARQNLSPPSTSEEPKYSRLVARFLLLFSPSTAATLPAVPGSVD